MSRIDPQPSLVRINVEENCNFVGRFVLNYLSYPFVELLSRRNEQPSKHMDVLTRPAPPSFRSSFRDVWASIKDVKTVRFTFVLLVEKFRSSFVFLFTFMGFEDVKKMNEINSCGSYTIVSSFLFGLLGGRF